MLFTRVASLVRRGAMSGHDDLGDPIFDPGTSIDVPAWYEHSGSTENTVEGQQVITGYILYLPIYARQEFNEADAVILDFDPVEFQVVGEVGYIPDGFILDGYCLAKLERVRG